MLQASCILLGYQHCPTVSHVDQFLMRPDSCELETFRSLLVLLSKATQNAGKLSLVQFVNDSCCLISQSNYMNNSKNDRDWLILAYFIR